jgi:sec-independent protein translocase protein TatB
MFDIGFSELSLLAVLGLLVLGPERLPAVARVLGGYLRKARRTWNTVKAEIETELAAADIRNTIQQPLDELDELRKAANEMVDLESKPEDDKPTDSS